MGPVPFLDSRVDAEPFERAEPPPHAAMGIVVDANGQVLLNLRDDDPRIVHPNRWSLLGGMCEAGETAHAAVVRELEEEAGLRVQRAVPFRRLVDREGRGHRLTAFVVPTRIPLSAMRCQEGQDMRFFGEVELLRLDLVPFARRLLVEFFAVVRS